MNENGDESGERSCSTRNPFSSPLSSTDPWQLSSKVLGLVRRMLAVLLCLCVTARAEEKAAEPDAKTIKTLEAKSFVIPDANGIKMMLIPAGTFTMGSPRKEKGRADDEKQHEVSISKPFYMAATETSQRQYLSIMVPGYEEYTFGGYLPQGKEPKLYEDAPHLGPEGSDRDMSRRPMDGVTWEKANTFCAKLTAAERQAGRLPKGYVYRLPTEAEWEYACRAGTDGPYGVDNKDRRRLPHFREIRIAMEYGACNHIPHGWFDILENELLCKKQFLINLRTGTGRWSHVLAHITDRTFSEQKTDYNKENRR